MNQTIKENVECPYCHKQNELMKLSRPGDRILAEYTISLIDQRKCEHCGQNFTLNIEPLAD
jgi:uncharacterized Zn-finger protein